MTTSFTAKFPLSTIRNIRVFAAGTQRPEDWAKQNTSALKVGDIVICFNPFNTADGANAELETSAMILVFAVDQNGPMGILLTDDFYAYGATEAIIRERAMAAAARNSNFSFVSVPFIGSISEEAKKFITTMSRWGSGTRTNPLQGLPDPLVAFFACIGSPLPAKPLVGINLMAQALIKGVYNAPVPILSTKYSIVAGAGPQPEISSVTMLESSATSPSSAGGPSSAHTVSADRASAGTTPGATASPTGDQSATTNPVSAHSANPQSSGQTPAGKPENASPNAARPLVQNPFAKPPISAGTSQTINAPVQDNTFSSVPPAPGTTIGDLQQSLAEAASQPVADDRVDPRKTLRSAPTTPQPAADSQTSESGFLSIRKRLEARLAGRLPKSSGSSAEIAPKAEPASPALKLVSNIRQQMSIASDNLEYRVSTLKSKMLDRLVSCKHNLGEKEQLSMRALEDLRTKMQAKLEYTATKAKEELQKCASQGTTQVRQFQSKAPGHLADLLAEQEKLIAASTEEAKRKVNESLAATRDELNKTVSRAQHTLRGTVTTTEVNLNQVVNQCAESMDERIEGFRAQTQILAEGIGLSVESLGEAAKLQAQQSEDEVIKRLEALSEESLKSLREQSVKAEMECSKLIDKLSRDKLVPTLQDKRRVVVELAAFFHDEFNIAMQELLENRLSEFEPIVRAGYDVNVSTLQDFKTRWTTNLEQHQKDLDDIETKLRMKVEEYLSNSRSHLESMQDITKVTDYVLTSPELIRARDETMLKFDIMAREHVSKAFGKAGDKVNESKQEALEELTEMRERAVASLRIRGEESRTRIRGALKTAMQKIQDLQSRYTS